MAYVPFGAAVVGDMNMSLLVVVVGDMGVGIGAVGAVVAVSRGDNTTNGEAASDVRIGAVLEGVIGRSTVWTAWNRVIGE